jgi:hypothetical protein
MGLGSGQASADLAFFPWLRPARGTTNRQRFLLCDFHAYTMRGCSRTRWSIVTIVRSYRRRIIAVERVDCQAYQLPPYLTNIAASHLHPYSWEQ